MATYRYRVVLAGQLSDVVRRTFEDLEVAQDGRNITLVGDLDQAALHGVLHRVHALGLELIEAVRIPQS
jgi:hypothetical protein